MKMSEAMKMSERRAFDTDGYEVWWFDIECYKDKYTTNFTVAITEVDAASTHHTRPVCHGFVRWDGCLNIEFDASQIMYHFCDPEQANKFTRELFRLIWDHAPSG